ncbi:hypothetical protein LP417_09945 [Polaromonas sp. P1-6]|nr:hypothetical protein LP417_09945 [Polaromonas sp. P1-6]
MLQSSKYQHSCRLHFPAMTFIKTSATPSKNIPPRQPPRIALALAGGGPLGAIYEIGALCALDESLQGLSFTHLHHYVERLRRRLYCRRFGQWHDTARVVRRLH